MRWRNYIAKRHTEKVLAFLITCTLVVGDFGYGLMLFVPNKAEAAQVTIDTTANAAAHIAYTSWDTDGIHKRPNGYKFYRDFNLKLPMLE